MLKSIKYFLISLTALTLIACSSFSQEINNPEGNVPQGLSADDVSKALEQALVGRGWQITSNENGVINAILFVRSHKAAIEIPYDNLKFAILYKDSENMNAKGNMIHNKYNHWVNNILVDTNVNLSKIAHIK